jgi:carboxyl-terminal processing protease
VRYNHKSYFNDHGGQVTDNQQPAVDASQHSTGISKNLFFLAIAFTVVIGFVAGTRSNEIFGLVGPLLGFKVEAGSLDLSSVQNTYRNLKANYDGTLDAEALITGANKGLVNAAGDQYTVFMDVKEAKDFEDDLSGQIGGGIGAEIGVRSGQPTIIRVLPDNPAEKIGVKAGDVIVAVNDESAKDWPSDKTADKVRGDIGTTVKLTVRRGEETKTFNITRANVTNPSVSSSIQDGIGVIDISRFDSETGNLARKAAENFKAQNVKGVILDLRDNGGGYITAAQDVAGLWLNDKTVVSERTGGKVVDELKSGGDPILAGIPTVVLVNGSSASASEIVSGALQDYKAATLVGEKTFGKGTVQKVIDLPGGTKLKVTVARWYTPNGKNITKEGIEPNQKVIMSSKDVDEGKDPQMDAAKASFNK